MSSAEPRLPPDVPVLPLEAPHADTFGFLLGIALAFIIGILAGGGIMFAMTRG